MLTTTNYKHFGFTVTDDNDADNCTGFEYREKLIITGHRAIDTVTKIVILDDDNGVAVQLVFLDEKPGETRDIAFCGASLHITFIGVEENKRLDDCILLGGRKFEVDID